jgi:hypothetical protein
VDVLGGDECASFAAGLSAKGAFAPDWSELRLARKVVAFANRLANTPENAGAIAGVLAAAYQPVERVLLWTHGLIWGDRTQDPTAWDGWQGYGHWRKKHGVAAGLHEGPGLLFQDGEHELLGEAIKWTVLTGSDALAIDVRCHLAIELSHHDIITVRSRTRPSAIGDRLKALGLRELDFAGR